MGMTVCLWSFISSNLLVLSYAILVAVQLILLANFAVLFAKPNNYPGAIVDVTGEVSNSPESGLLEMYVGGGINTDTVVHYNETFVFIQNDCVKVTGIVEEEFAGTNMFSARSH